MCGALEAAAVAAAASELGVGASVVTNLRDGLLLLSYRK